MKKTTLTVLAMAVAISAFAQGTITFNNASSANGVSTRVFGPESDQTVSKVGNRASDTPTGTQTYSGVMLSGSNYRAELWGAAGLGAAEGALQAGAGSNTPFRTGSGVGVVSATTVTFANIPKDSAAGGTFQMRVWDNTSGLYPTWASAETAWNQGLILAGKSPLLSLAVTTGGDFNGAPYLAGLQSFNIYSTTVIPEPATFALAGLGAAALLIFRRRK